MTYETYSGRGRLNVNYTPIGFKGYESMIPGRSYGLAYQSSQQQKMEYSESESGCEC